MDNFYIIERTLVLVSGDMNSQLYCDLELELFVTFRLGEIGIYTSSTSRRVFDREQHTVIVRLLAFSESVCTKSR